MPNKINDVKVLVVANEQEPETLTEIYVQVEDGAAPVKKLLGITWGGDFEKDETTKVEK